MKCMRLFGREGNEFLLQECDTKTAGELIGEAKFGAKGDKTTKQLVFEIMFYGVPKLVSITKYHKIIVIIPDGSGWFFGCIDP